MAQRQNKKKSLLCTYKNCKNLQTADGEFCKKHYPYNNMINCSTKTDTYLIKKREILMDWIEKDRSQDFIDKLHNLLEIERELTLREER